MIRPLPILGVTAAAVILLSGCAAGAPADTSDELSIVASTSVYGNLAASIAGDLATVTSIIDDSAVDPHSFEASARDQLAIADADLIIENGGGYDPFMDSLIEASGSSATVVEAVEASGLLDDEHSHGADEDGADDHADDAGHDHIEGFNEHVWYSLHGMTHVVEAIAAELGTLDSDNAETYEANAADLTSQLEALETRATDLATQIGGGGAAVTEPVPVYLLEAIGLTNVTPSDFTEAIEEGNDVPPLALEDTIDLFAAGDARVLGYNEQTASPETERVRDAAESAGVPVVGFSETLPDGADYVSWMSGNLDALASALLP